jgi:nicotinamidase-related amidase
MTTLTTLPAHAKSRLSIAGDAILLLADLQAGIADLPLTVPEAQLKRGVAALVKLAAIFEIPVIITVVPGGDGAVSALMDEVEAGRGGAPLFVRTTPDSFNDAEIRAAIEASGRRTLLVSGVATEVAVALPCLTAAAEGYDVQVVLDACGGISPRTEDAALRRMVQAGVRTTSVPTLIGELAGDFTQPKGGQAIGVLFELAGG